MTTDDERSVAEILVDEILSAEKKASEIRAASERFLADEKVRMMLSPAMLTRAAGNFYAYATSCEMTAKRMRELARQLGITAPNPVDFSR